MSRSDRFGRRLLVAIDAKSYGSGDDQRHDAIQNGLLVVLDEAAAEAHLARADWLKQPAGDSELAVLPPAEPEPRVVADFVYKLAAALRHHNRDLQAARRLRLRLAIHHGTAMPSSNGFSGQGIVVVSRLVDSPPLRTALAVSGADLAVIVSRQVFMDTVVQGHTSLEPTALRKVTVRNKEFVDDAWIWVPDGDVHSLDLSESEAEPPPDEPIAKSPALAVQQPAAATVHTEFHGPVHAPRSTFGISQGR